MKKILIAITGLLIIASLSFNVQAQDSKQAQDQKKMSCCMHKTGDAKSDTTKCKDMKADATKCAMKCSEMKAEMKDCDPAKCKDKNKK